MPSRVRKVMVSRSGPRIESARAIFGATSSPASQTLPSVATDALEIVQAALMDKNLRPTAISSRLSSLELQGSLAANLLDFYFVFTQENPTLLDEIAVRKSFEAAGRQLDHLDDQSQVLLAVVVAVAARSSDHPLIIGSSSIGIADLGEATLAGTDLSEFGRRRKTACDALTRNAMRLADEKGTLRVATMESLGSLMLIEELVQTWEIDDSPQRPWRVSSVGHVRQMLESDPGEQKLAGSVLGWTAFVREALVSGHMGRSCTFSEDDQLLLCDGFGLPPRLNTVFNRPMTLDPQGDFWLLFNSWMFEIAQMASTTAKHLTGVSARRATRMDEEFVCECLRTLDLGFVAIPKITALAARYDSLGLPHSRGIYRHFRTLQIMRCSQIFLLHDIVSKRAALYTPRNTSTQGSICEIGVGFFNGDDDCRERLEALRNETHPRAFAAAREVAALLEELIQSRAPLANVEWADIRSLHFLFVNIRDWASLLVDCPANEEGGPEGFTFDAKLKELNSILKSLWSMSWTFEQLSRPAPWLQGEITEVQLRQRAYWETIMGGYDPSPEQGTPIPSDGEEVLLGGPHLSLELMQMLGLDATPGTVFDFEGAQWSSTGAIQGEEGGFSQFHELLY